MKNKKAELASIVILTAIFVAGFSALYFLDSSNQVTGAAVAGVNISNCINITNSSVLTQDIQANLTSNFSNSICLDIRASNITLDCRGHSVTGNGNGNGIGLSAATNVTLKNCRVSNFYIGIYVLSNNSFIINNTVSLSGEDGFYEQYHANNFYQNNTAVNNFRNGFFFYRSDNITSSNNYASNNTQSGFNIVNTSNSRFYKDSAQSCHAGFAFQYNASNNFIHGASASNGPEGFLFSNNANQNTINASTASNNTVDLRVSQSDISLFLSDSSFNTYRFQTAQLSFVQASVGELSYLSPITIDPPDSQLTTNRIQISQNRIFINSSAKPGLNQSANLTFYNITFEDPRPLWDPEDDSIYTNCPASVCTEIQHDRFDHIYKYNVTHFTSFSTNETPVNCSTVIIYNRTLIQDITSNASCLIINNSNVTLNCQGHSITGSSLGYGINLTNINNSLIKNCRIINFTKAITLASSHSNNLTNNTLLDNTDGMVLTSSSNNQIINNNINHSAQFGIDLVLSDNNLLSNNLLNIFASGIQLSNSSSNTILDNNIINGNAMAVYLTNSQGNNLTGNTAGNNQIGFDIYLSDQNTLANNSVSGNSQDLKIQYSNFTSLINPVFTAYNFSNSIIILENTSAGELYFLNSVTALGNDLTQDVQINNNQIFVNTSAQPGFNTSANLTHYSLLPAQNQTFWDPEDDGSFVRCPSSVCTNLSYNSTTGDFSYQVIHFTTFKGDSNTLPQLTIPSFTPSTVFINNSLTGNTTYTDQDNDNGTVFFNWTVNNNQVRYVNYSSIVSSQSVTDTLGSGNYSSGQNITLYVQAYDGYNYSLASQNLIVVSNTPPNPVNLTSPGNNSFTGPTPTFNWTNTTDLDNNPLTFRLEISTSPGFTALVLNQSTSQLSYSLNSTQNLSNGTHYWRVAACDSQTCTYSTEIRAIKVDLVSPTSTITSLTDNADIGKNSFPVNISGTASDNVGLSHILVYINGTFYNATGTTNWNYSWIPAADDEYLIYSLAVDSFGNNETYAQIFNEYYYIETYNSSNLTNSNKINSVNLNSDIINSKEADSNINISWIELSEFRNVTSKNCTINNSDLNHSQCYDSLIRDCTGSGWYVDPSNITNVTGNNNNFTDANVSDSYVDNSNVSDSEVRNSNITSTSLVNGSHVFNSNISDSQVDYSTINNSEVDNSEVNNSGILDSDVEDSTVTDSNVTNNSTIDNSTVTNSTMDNSTVKEGSDVDNSNVTDSAVTDSNVTDSQIDNSDLTSTNSTNSTITDSTVDDSDIENSDVDDSTVSSSTITNTSVNSSTVTGSTLDNVTIVNSSVTNAILNNTNITNNFCYSGTLVYRGNTYFCSPSNPINLIPIFNPPAPTGGGGGGGRIPYECNDNIDNDGDGLIDYPADPGCLSIYDDEEEDIICQQSWICSQWSKCLNNTQTRNCYDVNQCHEKLAAGQVERVINTTKPIEEKTCALPSVPSCHDNIQNQREEGVDCGGPCPPCPVPPECLSAADCPENYDCINNTCIPLPERKPLIPTQKIISFFKSAYGGVANAFSFILGWTKETFAQLWQFNKTLNQKVTSLIKDVFSKIISFTRENYGPVIIVVLTVALIIAGIFAYQNFIHSTSYEKAKKKQKQIQNQKEKHRLQQASQQLTNYVRNALFAGYRPAQVKKFLVSAGWPKKIANKYTDKIYEIYKKDLRSVRKLSKLESQDLAIKKSLKKPKSGISFFQKPEITREEAPVREEPHRKLFDRITHLIQQDKSKEEITNVLIQEKWPSQFVRDYLHTHFPQLQKIAFFKKEVEDLEETLKKLKKR